MSGRLPAGEEARMRNSGLQAIMPAALNACTHAPTIMIGEKTAEMLPGEPGGRPVGGGIGDSARH